MSLLQMRPFELTITRNAGPTDTRQVPAAGATVKVAFEGATVKTAVTVLDHSTAVVQVTNTGRLQVGAYVIQNYDESPALVVAAVSVTGVAVTLANEDTGVNVELGVGDRLFVVGGFTGGRVSWTASNDVYEYVAAANRWVQRAAMPTGRGGLGAAVLGGRVHVLGGAVGSALNAHEVYDPAANRWTRRTCTSVAAPALRQLLLRCHGLPSACSSALAPATRTPWQCASSSCDSVTSG